MNRRPWKRLAMQRAARRRGTKLAPPLPEGRLEPIPPLEPPDDDREFLPAFHPAVRTYPKRPDPRTAVPRETRSDRTSGMRHRSAFEILLTAPR